MQVFVMCNSLEERIRDFEEDRQNGLQKNDRNEKRECFEELHDDRSKNWNYPRPDFGSMKLLSSICRAIGCSDLFQLTWWFFCWSGDLVSI